MRSYLCKVLAVLVCVALGPVLRASPINVTELGMGPNETVYVNSSTLGNQLHVYAGVVRLQLGGNMVDGFCIDPWHWSGSGPQPYNSEPLQSAPKNPTGSGATGMGATAALQIEELWAQYYSAAISPVYAAALQIKIWEIVDGAEPGGTFSLVSVDSNSAAVYSALSSMDSYLGSSSTLPRASLVGISGQSGQDYVVASTPDGGSTAGLVAAAFIALTGLVRVNRRMH